jgi:hypothetical protein
MWGSCRGRLTQHWSEFVECVQHRSEATLKHAEGCQHLKDLPKVGHFKHLMETKNFRAWDA